VYAHVDAREGDGKDAFDILLAAASRHARLWQGNSTALSTERRPDRMWDVT
jgi:hypothetical protein